MIDLVVEPDGQLVKSFKAICADVCVCVCGENDLRGEKWREGADAKMM